MKTRTTYCEHCKAIRSHDVNVACHPDHEDLCNVWLSCFDCNTCVQIDEHENAFDYERRTAELRWPGDRERQARYHAQRRNSQWMSITMWAEQAMSAIYWNAREDNREITAEDAAQYARFNEIFQYAMTRWSGDPR